MVCAALVNALGNDSSYAVQGAAAEALGNSGTAQAFDALQNAIARNPDVHVMRAALDGLAASRDPRAVPILLAKAQPGELERVRLGALSGLEKFAETLQRDSQPQVATVVRAAVDDSFAPVQQAGTRLAVQLKLKQLCPDVQVIARNAPTSNYRVAAETVLQQLQCPQAQSQPGASQAEP